MQTAKEIKPHPRIAPCVIMWSATSWMLVHAYTTSVGKAKWSGPHQQRWHENKFNFHSVTCYTKSIVSRIHVNTTKPRNITCTLVATSVILRSLEFIPIPHYTLQLLRNINLLLLLYPGILHERMFSVYISLLVCCHVCCHFVYNHVVDIQLCHQRNLNRTRHDVVVMIVVIHATLLAMCYSIVPHATLILFISHIHVSTT